MVSYGVRWLDPSARQESQVVLSRMLGEAREEVMDPPTLMIFKQWHRPDVVLSGVFAAAVVDTVGIPSRGLGCRNARLPYSYYSGMR